MSNPINKELRELRMAKEHYHKILDEDTFLKKNNIVDDVKLLTDENIKDINNKIEAINQKIEELLSVNKD